MAATYADLTPDALAPLGFDDPVRSCHLLREMAGHDVPDALFETLLQSLLAALADCADPDRAAANFGRWADALPHRVSGYGLLASHPVTVKMLTSIFAASQFFADLIIQTPEYLEVLLNPAIRDRGRDLSAFQADLARRVAVAGSPNAKRDALRRFKPPEVLRIGARDLLGYAAMPETAREISDFADACVQMALKIGLEEHQRAGDVPFAVIAMGKLGGQELNYASDIDLIFVHGDDFEARDAIRLAEAVRDTLERVTAAGFVFRVDLRLRPEGRFGPISRSLASCRAYYESWAEPWERQALLKARFAAGDTALGHAFLEMAHAYVYRSRVEETFVDNIRANKRRMEQKIAHAGEARINVKEGVGGIRDIEFLVQLFQLVAGGRHPEVQTGATLTALPRLADLGLLTVEECTLLSNDYQFLRTVEHRLQIMDERPIRNLPTEPSALDKFGRRLGFESGQTFRREYDRRTSRVNFLFRRLFYAEEGADEGEAPANDLRAWVLTPDDPIALIGLRTALQADGFAAPDAALALLRRSSAGSEYGGIAPEARENLAAMLPMLLDSCRETEDPDAALRGILSLADAVPSRGALFHAFLAGPFLPRLCRLAASSPFLWQILLSHLEYSDLLADEEAMEGFKPPSAEAQAADAQALASVRRRSLIHIGARDIWDLAETAQVMREWTQTTEWALDQALGLAMREQGFSGRMAVIGLGKLGGSELGYGSDADVLFVADTPALAEAARAAERAQTICGKEMGRYGQRIEIDARLRPDGRKGAIVLDLPSYRRYYENAAATWERHALVKARAIAGDAALGAAFQEMAAEIVYGKPWTEAEMDEVRAMKRRIENERVKAPRDLKLAPGGMADIEWTTQILQLKHGGRRRCLRATGTLAALMSLRDDALMTQAEWETLSTTYVRLIHVRNRLYLRSGIAADMPPTLPDDLAARMRAVREIAEHRLFGFRES